MEKNNYSYGLLIVKTLVFICVIVLLLSFTSCADNHVEHNPENTQESSSGTYQQEPVVSSKETTATYDINQYSAGYGVLATMCNGNTYYYSSVIFDPRELAYYISLAEYAGSVEIDLDDDYVSPQNNLESNYLPVGTKLYLLDSYMIAEYCEPHQWYGKIIYGQVLGIKEAADATEPPQAENTSPSQEQTADTKEPVIPDVADRPYGTEVTIFADNTFDCDYSDYEEIAYNFYDLRRSVMAPKGWTSFRYYEEMTSFENMLTGIPIYDGPLPVKIDMFDYTTQHANAPMRKSIFFFAEYPWMDPYSLINSSSEDNINKYDHESYTDKKGRTMQVYFLDGLPKYAVYDDFFNLCIWFNLDSEEQIPTVVNMINSIDVTLSREGEFTLERAKKLGYTIIPPEE